MRLKQGSSGAAIHAQKFVFLEPGDLQSVVVIVFRRGILVLSML